MNTAQVLLLVAVLWFIGSAALSLAFCALVKRGKRTQPPPYTVSSTSTTGIGRGGVTPRTSTGGHQ